MNKFPGENDADFALDIGACSWKNILKNGHFFFKLITDYYDDHSIIAYFFKYLQLNAVKWFLGGLTAALAPVKVFNLLPRNCYKCTLSALNRSPQTISIVWLFVVCTQSNWKGKWYKGNTNITPCFAFPPPLFHSWSSLHRIISLHGNLIYK